MCGVAGMFGPGWRPSQLEAMVASQGHRGPDASGVFLSPRGLAGLGHNRLSIIDLSEAGRQPMSDATARFWISFNGEIYNYLELRAELERDHAFRTQTDTEVLLAAYLRWGAACLDRLVGMFAFLIWDEQEQQLFGARDRFGVKPLHLSQQEDGGVWIASEIKALHAAGLPRVTDPVTWSTYLASGMYDQAERTFWKGVHRIPPGTCFTWRAKEGLRQRAWYDLAERVLSAGPEERTEATVASELLHLLDDTVRLRFRADVPVGICLSGGLDSSLLLALVHRLKGPDSTLKTFTFICGAPDYDETPWVEAMLRRTRHPACFCRLSPEDVPGLAAIVLRSQDEPFGGLPTLGMACVHRRAREEGVVVLLDGNGLDEGWAGYDYYARSRHLDPATGPVQGSSDRPIRPECLNPEFLSLAEAWTPPRPFQDPLLDLQYRDIRFSKIPRAMRFADRVSMQYSRELREPFLDHRIMELGLRQPADRKLRNGMGKHLPRSVARQILPPEVREAPKRPVQTPQREWFRGSLREWVEACVGDALRARGDWFDARRVEAALGEFQGGAGDNSFFVWQWLSLGLLARDKA